MVEVLGLILKGGGNMMNTSEVAKLLGVSASTIQRWVKQLELPMERNERGHYHFNQEDIELLKSIKEQIQSGTLLQDIAPPQVKKSRTGVMIVTQNDKAYEKLAVKVSELEVRLNDKADSVTSYQLLQHRSEIEDLQKQIKLLTKQLETIQNQLKGEEKIQLEKPLVFDQTTTKRKKKNFVSSLFGF